MSHDLQLTIQPQWHEIERLNDQATAFLKETPLAASQVDIYAMVICELTENAIKYGRPGAVINLSATVTNTTVSVQVSNKINRHSQSDLRSLDQTLQWVRGVQDPYQAYLERIREISREPLSDARSCLGLIRIMYEARAEVDFVLEDDTLNVSAQARI